MMKIDPREWIPEGAPSESEMALVEFAEAHAGTIDVGAFGDVNAAIAEGVRVSIDWSGKWRAKRDDVAFTFSGASPEEAFGAAVAAEPDAPDPVCPECGARVRKVSRGKGNFQRWVAECTQCDWEGFDQALYAWHKRAARQATIRERAADRRHQDRNPMAHPGDGTPMPWEH